MKLHTGPTGALQAAGAVPTPVSKTVTFVAGTTGAVGAHDLFTVTGDVLLTYFGIKCSTALTVGGSTTLVVGTANNTSFLFDGADGPLDLTTWDAGYWALADSVAQDQGQTIVSVPISLSADIINTIGTSTITGGVLTYYLTYVPLSAGASVVAA